MPHFPIQPEITPYNADLVLGTNDDVHMLIENINKRDIQCYFCSLQGKKSRSIYGCVACKKGYHVNFFTAYHCRGALSAHSKELIDTILQTNENRPRFNKKSKHVGDITNLRL